MTAEEILEDGINDGTYADITDQINVSTETAFFKAIVRFAEDYASERIRDELIKFCAFKVPATEPVLLENYIDEYLRQRK